MWSKVVKTRHLWIGPLIVIASQSYKHFVEGKDFNYELLLLVVGVLVLVEIINRGFNRSSQNE